MKLLLATSNPHKFREIRAVIPDALVHLHSLTDLPAGESLPEPVEDQPTFDGNATLKARYYAAHTGEMTLADDSGLEVDALDGAPGVRSARYSGHRGSRAEVDLANNRLLLQQLGDIPPEQRTARFVCAMALCAPGEDQPRALVRGTLEGRIITPQQAADPAAPERGIGANGFGYDPLFFLPNLNCTSAQLTPSKKNAISHRGLAARNMADQLQRLGIAPSVTSR